jgi:Uma2 family endonuclease
MGLRAYEEYYTYKDYQLWKGDWELIDGFPIAMSPSPMISHQAIASSIAFEFMHSVDSCENCLVLSEEDWKMSDDTVVRPDVVLICNEPHDAYITKRPEIVVEIVSQSSVKRDETVKFSLYQSEKVPYYMVVYPDDLKAKIYKLVEGKFESEGSFLTEMYETEGLTCDVSIDFARVFKKFRKRV